MTVAVDVAIGAAERLERTAGPAAGLALFRRLAANADGAELRGRAILGGLRCAASVGDRAAARDLALLWRTMDAGVWIEVFSACKTLHAAGLREAAGELANAEAKLRPTARALYMRARCLDVARDPHAADAFREAIAQGEQGGPAPLVASARVRRAFWLSRSVATLPAALDEAKRVEAAAVTPPERLVLARVLLRAPSRFVRAGALSILDDLVRGTDDKLARAALRTAARHADDMADALTPLEVDRLLALLGREPIAAAAAAARDALRAVDAIARAREKQDAEAFDAALLRAAELAPPLAPLHRRAREILAGRFEAHDAEALARAAEPPSLSPYALWTSLLDAVVAMRDAAHPRAARALRTVAERAERAERLPPQTWTIVQKALVSDDDEVRAVAGRAVAALAKTTSAAPPSGWLALANVLTACGMESLAGDARRSAALANEPGAADALVLTLTRSAWQLAAEGERSRAIEQLREARALAARRGQPPSPAATPSTAEASAPSNRST